MATILKLAVSLYFFAATYCHAGDVTYWDGERYVSLERIMGRDADDPTRRAELNCLRFQAAGERDRLLPMVYDTARAYGLNPKLLDSVVLCESGYRADALSAAGAIGLAQLMPATALRFGVDPSRERDNLVGAAKYLSWLLGEFDSISHVIAAYNAGEGAVRRAAGVPSYNETQLYVRRVLYTMSRVDTLKSDD